MLRLIASPPRWESSGSSSGLPERVLAALPFLLIAALLPVYVLGMLTPGAGSIHDDGVYLATSKSLAEGRGYRIDSLPEAIPQTKYPFLYPGLLALVWKAFPSFPANVLAFKALALACTLLWIFTVYRLCLELGLSRRASGWICFVTLSSRWVLFVSTTVLPDSLFSLLSTAGLLVLMRIGERRPSHEMRYAVLAGLLCGGAFLTRTAGMALIGAGGAGLLWRRQVRAAAVFLLCCAALCVPWLIWQAQQAAPADGVLAYYSKNCYKNGSVFTLPDFESRKDVLLANAGFLALGFHFLLPFPYMGVGMLLSLGLSLAVAAGLMRAARGRAFIPVLWFVSYSGLIWLWVWMPDRYQIPMLPLAAAAVALALGAIRRDAVRKLLTGGLLACAVVAGVFSFAENARAMSAGQITSFWRESIDRTDNIARMGRWLAENTPSQSVISANNDALFYLLSGRKAIRLFAFDAYKLVYQGEGSAPLGPPAAWKKHLLANRVDYLAMTPMQGFRETFALQRLLQSAILDCPGVFRPVMKDEDRRYYVLKVDRVRLAACPVGNRPR